MTNRFCCVVAALALVTAGAFPARAGQPGDSPGVSAIQTIYVVSTSHWDYGFTDPPANLPALIRAHINDAVAKCQTDVRHRYTIESVWMFEDYMSVASQAEKDNLLTLIRAGRIALSSSYTGPHSGIMSPEELNRWIYRAKRARDTYNITTRTAHVDDNPGYTWALPDALAGAGVDRLVAGCNTAFASEFPLPRNESIFRWRGPGGGETLTWVSRDAYTEGFSTWQIDANAARLFYGADHPEWVGWSNQQIMAQGITAQLGVLDAAGYPYDAALAILAFDKMNYDASGQLLNDITTWNANHTSPHIVLATADEFFDHMVATYGLGAFPVRTGNWTQRWERGKAYGMICEARFREMRDLLPAAETFSSVASQFGASYPSATFDTGWRDLMRFDDHGAGLGGTQAGEMTLAECNATNLYWMQTSQARQNDARGAVATAQTSIGSRIATPAGANPDVVVFNGLSSARTDIATATIPSGGQPFALRDVATNAPVPYRTRTDGSIEFVAENVPALGLRRYRALIGQTDTWPATVTATSTTNTATVESQTYRVTISKTTGEVTSIVDKTAGNRELVNSGSAFKFNRTVKAKNLTDFLGGVPSTQTTATATVTTRSGPVSGSLTVSYALPGGGRQSSPMSRIDVTLYDKLKRIDIVDTFDRSRLTYTIAVSDHSDHFYAPMPFNVPTAQLRTFIDGNAPVPFEPPSATYLSGPTVTAVNNSDLPSRGLTLRDSAAAFEIQVVSPQVFWYVVGGNLNSNTYAPWSRPNRFARRCPPAATNLLDADVNARQKNEVRGAARNRRASSFLIVGCRLELGTAAAATVFRPRGRTSRRRRSPREASRLLSGTLRRIFARSISNAASTDRSSSSPTTCRRWLPPLPGADRPDRHMAFDGDGDVDDQHGDRRKPDLSGDDQQTGEVTSIVDKTAGNRELVNRGARSSSTGRSRQRTRPISRAGRPRRRPQRRRSRRARAPCQVR